MLLDLDYDAWGTAPVRAHAIARHVAAAPAWSAIVPFFNEADNLPAMLASLAAQTVAVRVILVDNGSTDGSGAIAERECRRLGLDHRLIRETRPGKVRALTAGLPAVDTPLVATCDADTWYPAQYLAAAGEVLARPGCVIAGAFYVPPACDADRIAQGAARMQRAARLLPRQCHTGGAGQCFNTAALRAAGGFDAARWNLVLEDHEIIHRVMQHGTMGYADTLWCVPSPRERNRDSIRWTLTERLVYSAAAPWAGDWFFYRFLGPRLSARKLTSQRIRERPFQVAEGLIGGATAAMC